MRATRKTQYVPAVSRAYCYIYAFSSILFEPRTARISCCVPEWGLTLHLGACDSAQGIFAFHVHT